MCNLIFLLICRLCLVYCSVSLFLFRLVIFNISALHDNKLKSTELKHINSLEYFAVIRIKNEIKITKI